MFFQTSKPFCADLRASSTSFAFAFEACPIVSSFGGLITYIRDRLDNVYHDPATIIDNIGSISLGLIPYISFFEGIREQKKFILNVILLLFHGGFNFKYYGLHNGGWGVEGFMNDEGDVMWVVNISLPNLFNHLYFSNKKGFGLFYLSYYWVLK